jgi:hypothetical protein
MPVHIERMTSEVAVQSGDLALSQGQMEKLVALVINKLEERAREAQKAHAATKLRRQASRPLEAGE